LDLTFSLLVARLLSHQLRVVTGKNEGIACGYLKAMRIEIALVQVHTPAYACVHTHTHALTDTTAHFPRVTYVL
jgi:hypothetical protein